MPVAPAAGAIPESSYLDVWYDHLDVDEIYRAFDRQLTKKERERGAF